MQKTNTIMAINILIIIILISGCGRNSITTLNTDNFNGLNISKSDEYQIEVDFNPEGKLCAVKQTVKYVNKEDVALKDLFFHIYPNAFNDKNTLPVLLNNFRLSTPEFKKGFMEFKEIKIDNQIIDYSLDNTILKLPLDKELKPGEKINIYMEYKIILPNIGSRFGYGKKTYNFGNWYPIAAVYDDEGWNLDPYYKIGDPFYSDINRYDVTIRAPEDFIIASSGEIKSERISGKNRVWKIEADLMRDFAWVVSKHFNVWNYEVGDTEVKIYFLENDKKINEYAGSAACNALNIFNRVFGEYPYTSYSIVETNFISGMEYPGLIFVSDNYFEDCKTKSPKLFNTIVHETAHQWWYGVVGNDQIDEAWLDESLAVYSTGIFTYELVKEYKNEKDAEAEKESYYKDVREVYYEKNLDDNDKDGRVFKSLNEFTQTDNYNGLIYGKGALFIYEIEKKYGKEILYQILREYYHKHRFRHATTENFISICEKITGDDFSNLVNEWLY